MIPGTIIESLLQKDLFSQWLGIEVVETNLGYCKLKMTIRPDMCNGFMIAHGGITYSLADSALAFASNSHGRQTLSIETSISHIKALYAGDVLTAIATEKSLTYRIGVYEVVISTESGELAALFKGTVYRKSHTPDH